jgi:uncharacterized protein (UPF0333 family)
MAGFLLLIAVVLAAASFTSYTAKSAAGASDSPSWATNACSSVHQLCQYPQELAIAAAGLVALWLLIKFVSAIRD